jgi:GNAT superfamily N-acetyltransferase
MTTKVCGFRAEEDRVRLIPRGSRGELGGEGRGERACGRGRVIASLALQKRKPWSIDVKHFHEAKKPAYLTSMAVDPAQQRKGLGRGCVEEARRIARDAGFDAIRLDAFDCAAGAGEFYLKCGFLEVARVAYKGVPLIDFEMRL